jgi:hypothetical protein
MAIVEINSNDGIAGTITRIVFRTEDITAVCIDDAGGANRSIRLWFRTGEIIPIGGGTSAQAQGIVNRIKAAM